MDTNFNIPKSGTGSSKDDKVLLDGDGDDEGIGTDGKFDSENFEKESNRTADGKRDVGPRKY